MKIAVSGKGGVGKTTLAASLALTFAQNRYQVYAIDADPDANLASLLGIKEDVKPLVDLKEVIQERVGGEGGIFSLNPKVDDILDTYAREYKGVYLLQMGAIKKANTACYCRENSFLRSIMDSLLFDKDEVVVMDMGAGIEHLTRGTSRGVDMMLVVSEAGRISRETAKRIQRLALDGGVKKVQFVGNKVRNHKEEEVMRRDMGQDLLHIIPYSEPLQEGGLEGSEPFLLQEAFDLYKKLVEGR